MKPFLIAFLLFIGCQLGWSQTSAIEQDREAILTVMKQQEKAWNQHDLEGFMEGYWKSDSLKFYGSRGIAQGWETTLNNYKKGYPTSKESGTLHFVIKSISPIENQSYYVMGEFHLTREVGNADGVFLIIFKKIDGQWRIIADLSC